MRTIAIFALRENERVLVNTIRSAVNALGGDGCIDVIINGQRPLYQNIVAWLTHSGQRNDAVITHLLPSADKAAAWNEHIHNIYRGSGHVAYIDGYVLTDRCSLNVLFDTMSSGQHVLGSSGVPSVGLSARRLRKAMLEQGGFHGNFCGISETALRALRARSIYIPQGMYRVDAVMSSFWAFGLNNVENHFQPKTYIPVSFNATWHRQQSLNPLVRACDYARRRDRQAKGDVENAAMKYLLAVRKVPLECLPRKIEEIVCEWKQSRPEEYAEMSKRSKRHRRWARLMTGDTA